MADRVRISNLALSQLGETDRITDPDQDSKPAREIAAVWDEARLEVLRGGNWNHATKRAALPALSGVSRDEIYPYGFAYQLPADALRLRDLLDGLGDHGGYQLEGRRILTNIPPPLRVRIIVDVQDASAWDASFVASFAKYLAYLTADAITGDRARKLDAYEAYRKSIADTKSIDALENPPEEVAESSWITARFGAGGYGGYPR